jgi:hypothetical protein
VSDRILPPESEDSGGIIPLALGKFHEKEVAYPEC